MSRREARHGSSTDRVRSQRKKEPGATRASHRLALKIAARTSIRSLGRSALIATMVALPIAGLSGVAVVYSSTEPTYEEIIQTQLGENEAVVSAWYSPDLDFIQDPTGNTIQQGDYSEADAPVRQPADVLPSGTRILTIVDTAVTATTESGRGTFVLWEGAVWDPAFAGMYDVVDGRSPRNDREVMVSPALLLRLGITVGESVDLHSPNDTVTVVGVIDPRNNTDDAESFFGRDAAFSGVPGVEREGAQHFLPDLELDWDDVEQLNKEGIVVVSRAVLDNPPPVDPQFFTNTPAFGKLMSVVLLVAIGGAFAIFEVVLLAGAAFTVTARQQQRTLATLASVGSPRRLLFRVLAANGIVLGAIGGIPGVAVGVGAAAGFMALTSDGSATQYYGFHVPWLALISFVVFGAVIGWLASLVPARNASRFDIVAALRGARKPPLPSKRKPIVGTVMLVAGIVLALAGGVLLAVLMEAGSGMPGGHPLVWVPILMLISGPLLAQVGLILCGPLVLRVISRAMSKSGVGARLASRDAARNPSRAVPALAAIMTTVFVAVFAMCMVGSAQASTIANHQHAFALGQIGTQLTHFTYDNATGIHTVHRYEREELVEAAIRDSVDVDELRVLTSVPSHVGRWPDLEGLPEIDPEVGAPIPGIAPENLCPDRPRSPEYDETIDSDPEYQELYRELADDWRCQSGFPHAIGPGSLHLLVGEAADLALVLDRAPSAAAIQTLRDGGAVSLYPEYVHDGEFFIEWWEPGEWERATYQGGQASPIRVETLNAVVELPDHPINLGVFISPATADQLGLTYENALVLASTMNMPTTEQQDALFQATATLPGAETGLYARVETGPQEFAELSTWGLVALAALIALASAAVAIGLARFDGRQDDATLGALGARRLVRKNFAFWQGIIIAGVGTVLGAGLGLVPALALGAIPDLPFVAPWLQIGITAVVLPLVIACGSWVFATGKTITARRMSIA